MQETLISNTLAELHFPQRVKLIKNLRYVSFLINDIVLLVSCVVFIVWLTNFAQLKTFFFVQLGIIPASSMLFMLAAVPLFFGARRHLVNNEDAKKEVYRWWNPWLPISIAGTVSLLGLISFVQLSSIKLLQTSPVASLCFFLIGLALIPPFTRIPHRFHLTQLFIFAVSGLSMLVVLENIYELFSPVPTQHIINIPLLLALTFAFFCFGVLLRWSNRGFFGNFTLDSTGSRLGLRIVLINLISIPVIAIIVLFTLQRTSYTMYQVLTVIITLLTFVSSLLIWINVKLLYKYSLEHLLMRESLRTHNIDLTKEEETLRQQMGQFEEEKKQYENKLNMQAAWRNAADASE